MASRFWVGGTGTWDASDTTHWAASSAGAGGQSVPVDGDTVTFDGSSGGGTVTLAYSPTVTSITMGAFTGTFDASTFSPTMDTFSCSGTGTRTLTMGSGTWTVRGNNATIWDFTTITNLTLTATTSTINCTYSGSTGTRTFVGCGAAKPYGDFKVSAGTDTINFTGSAGSTFAVNKFDLTGFSGVWSGTRQINATGDFTVSGTLSSRTFSGLIGMVGISVTQIFKSNGIVLGSDITVSAVGNVTRLFDELNIGTKTLTLTQGTLDATNNGAGNYNVTCGVFSSSNSNTRTLTMGSGTWTLTGNNATIFSTSTSTNLTFTASTATINCTYSGSVGTRTFSVGAVIDMTGTTVNFTAGTDILSVQLQTGGRYGSVSFVGFTGTLTGGGGTGLDKISGNLTLGSGMTVTSDTRRYEFSGTGSWVFTSNGVVFNRPITINGSNTTITLADNLAIDTASTGVLGLNAGTLNTNNKNVSAFSFSSTNSNTRVLTLGSSTITLTGTGTVWTTATSTNLTLNRGTSTIKISDTSATAKTFSGGGKTFYNLWYANGAGGASLTFVGSNTFNSVRDTSTAAHSLIFTAGTTQTVPIGSWFVTGKSGAVTTLASTTTSAFTLTFTGVGTISSDYMSISYCTISLPDKEFFVGTHSTDGGNNTRVYFTAPTLHRSNFYLFM